MKKALVAALVVLGLGLAFVAGSWMTWRSISSHANQRPARTLLGYTCPMHPSYHSDWPGDCPSCGMRLEPVYAQSTGAEGRGAQPIDVAGLLRISAERQQTIGVRLGVAEQSAGQQVVRTVGRVVADETRTYRITAAVDGWIRSVKANATGVVVRKGEVLGTFYGPEFLGAQQGYLFALGSFDRFKKGSETPEQLRATESSIKQASDGLRNLGMSEAQVAHLARSREIDEEIWITSPASGVVLERSVSDGQRFEKGDELYRVADLAHVWVLADVFESQADAVRPGGMARVSARHRQREYEARVSNVQALFDETSRTLKVRLEMDNPGYALKPGMFVDVDFPVSLPPAVTVPVEAVLDSGLRKVVFVDRGNGYFEPRRVETGWQVGDRLEIVHGLMAGERIVVSGNFLLDSESRMKAAAVVDSPSQARVDPVCGMDVDELQAKAAGRSLEHAGTTYYFCSDDCRAKFAQHPEKFTSR